MSNVNRADIHIDIETIPSQRPEIWEHLSKKVPDTMGMEEADAELQRLYLGTSLNGAFGEIVSISAAINNREPKVWLRALGESESDLLLAFRDDMMKAVQVYHGNVRLVGLNVADFDRPFIVQRGFAHGLWMPEVFTCEVKPWETHVVCELQRLWTRNIKGRISLNDLCFALGVEGKGAVDGSSVWQMMKDGRHADVGVYNASDVKKARACFNRLMTLR